MCDMYGHGFYWRENNRYKVLFDFEINCHSAIKEYRPEMIPATAKRCGFDPINGEPVTNVEEAMPEEVKEKIHFLFEQYFPNRASIAQWILANYAKHGDQEEWDVRLPLMLANNGKALLSKSYYIGWVAYYMELAADCTKQMTYYKQRAIYYKQRAVDCPAQAVHYMSQATYCRTCATDYTEHAAYCRKRADDYTKQAASCTGYISEMDIAKFIDYFMQNPNEYWSDRNTPREVEYKSFALIEF